jgi:BirA family biotin operon repressor/biotin-[acetyl-CoA-carboxylase] ligase
MPAGLAAHIDQPWCDLSRLDGSGAVPDRNRIAATVLEHWLPALEAFDVHGLAPFMPRYAALDALAGQPVSLHGEGASRSGVALGLAGDGALRVRLPTGEECSVHSGEVSIRCTERIAQ